MKKFFICLFIIFCVLLSQLPAMATPLVKSGQFKYAWVVPDGTERDCSATYHYRDDYFHKSSFWSVIDGAYVYDHSLATMSMCLAMSAFNSAEKSVPYSDKSQNVRNLLNDIDFINIEVNSGFQNKPARDSIGVALANKKITVPDGEEYTLIAVAIRGANYESEWASNFHAGPAYDDHQGFLAASQKVLEFLRDYVGRRTNQGDNIKVWITGYSRAGAVAGLAAAGLNYRPEFWLPNNHMKPQDLYAYCFEPPRSYSYMAARPIEEHRNIVSIVNPNDLVSKLPPGEFILKIPGLCVVLPTGSNKSNYIEYERKMLQHYNRLESNPAYHIRNFQMKKLVGMEVKTLLGIPCDVKVGVLVDDINNKIDLSTFLDEYMSYVAKNVFINRQIYTMNFQAGLGELFYLTMGTDSAQWELASGIFLNNVKNSVSGLVTSALFPHIIGRTEDILFDLALDALRKAGITNHDRNQIMYAMNGLMYFGIHVGLRVPNWASTFFWHINSILNAHYPELCLAWMMSRDPNYNNGVMMNDWGGITSGAYRTVRFNSSGEITVKDASGLVVARVGNILHDIPNGLPAAINNDGEKVVYVPADEDYSVEIRAGGSELFYSVNEYDFTIGDITRLVNIKCSDINSEGENIFRGSLPAYSYAVNAAGTHSRLPVTYSLTGTPNTFTMTYEDINAGDTNLYHFVNAFTNENMQCLVYGSRSRVYGSFAKVTAIQPKSGSVFLGWFENGQLVSTEPEYRFRVERNVNLMAQFEHEKTMPFGCRSNNFLYAILLFGLIIFSSILKPWRKAADRQ